MGKGTWIVSLLLIPLLAFGQVETLTIDSGTRNVINTGNVNFATGQLQIAGVPVTTGGGGGAVSSVFGRTGAVVAATNDYTFAQIGGKPTTLSGYGITDAEYSLGNPSVDGYILSSTAAGVRSWIVVPSGGGGAVSSVFGRTGAVVAASGDYTFAQIGSKPTTLAGYGITDAVPSSRTLTLGAATVFDLSANRTVTVDQLLGLSTVGLLKRTGANAYSTITDSSSNWDTGFTERRQWDGGSTNLVAATGRTSLGLVIGTNVEAWDADLDALATQGNPASTAFIKKSAGGGYIFDTSTYLNIVGTNTNDSAAAGNVGEYITQAKSSGSAVVLTNNINANICSISLTAGDWDVSGEVIFLSTGSCSGRAANIGTVSAAIADDGYQGNNGASTTTTVAIGCPLPSRRISLAATTTVYLVGLANFTTGGCNGYGNLVARRTR